MNELTMIVHVSIGPLRVGSAYASIIDTVQIQGRTLSYRQGLLQECTHVALMLSLIAKRLLCIYALIHYMVLRVAGSPFH